MTDSIQHKTLTNLFWRFAERSGAQIIQFIVSIVLARILNPEVYGTIALVVIFTQILQVFVDSGLGNALIQKLDADDLDFSSVFYFNVGLCLVLYLLMFLSAPYISKFYGNNDLTLIIRVLSLIIIISGVKNVQQAYVSKTLQFKKFFFSTLGGTIVSAIVGIVIALNNGGVWALVAQKLVNLMVDTIVLWITVGWRPKLMFSANRLVKLISYGWKLLASTLLDTVYNNLRQLIIGKLYTKSELAYFNQGKQFPSIIVTNINASIDSVLLPVMSSEQNYQIRIKSMTRRAIKTSIYLMAPLMIGLMVIADSLVEILLTQKWNFAVIYLRIFCVTFMFYPIHTANLNAIKAMGHSGLILRLEIIKKITGCLILFLSIRYGVLVMAYSMLIESVISQIINATPNKKLLDYGYIEQVKDIFPSIFQAIIMGGIIYPIRLLNINNVYVLCIQIILGGIIYILVSYISKNESFTYLLNVISPSLKYKKR